MDEVRVNRPNRRQPRFEVVDWEALIPADHPVRAVAGFVEKLDLGFFYDQVKARRATAGRPVTDPAMLLTLWIWATSEGIGSARALARLCERDAVYQWICGGVGTNHTTLSEFRTESGQFLDDLLTDGLTRLIAAGLLDLDEVTTDGTKVRASASRNSMRRKPRVQEIEARARARVATLKQELDADPACGERRRKSRALAAAREQAARVAAALAKFPARMAQRRRRAKTHPGQKQALEKKAPRVSTTDPDARLMRMADGAVRAAYNVQVSTACASWWPSSRPIRATTRGWRRGWWCKSCADARSHRRVCWPTRER
jgi:transposase